MTFYHKNIHKAFPTQRDKSNVIATILGCFYVLADELHRHVDPKKLDPNILYHCGLGFQLLGFVLGKIDVSDEKLQIKDLTNVEDFYEKLDLLVENLIIIRDHLREKTTEEVK